jgi:hypothetical protein
MLRRVYTREYIRRRKVKTMGKKKRMMGNGIVVSVVIKGYWQGNTVFYVKWRGRAVVATDASITQRESVTWGNAQEFI